MRLPAPRGLRQRGGSSGTRNEILNLGLQDPSGGTRATAVDVPVASGARRSPPRAPSPLTVCPHRHRRSELLKPERIKPEAVRARSSRRRRSSATPLKRSTRRPGRCVSLRSRRARCRCWPCGRRQPGPSPSAVRGAPPSVPATELALAAPASRAVRADGLVFAPPRGSGIDTPSVFRWFWCVSVAVRRVSLACV